ncbi:MAG: SDR family NAD(P)-dependent oxidoreductase [Sciscionella sp.]
MARGDQRENAQPARGGRVLVLGGRSEIGIAVTRLLVREGRARSVVLAARRSGELASEVELLRGQGAAAVHAVEFDADELDTHGALLDAVIAEHGPLDVVLLAFGVLGEQRRAERETAHALQIVHTDFTAQVSMLSELSMRLRAQRGGTVVVFSSVAGARVRRANYVYGAAKAGLDGFACGLGDALHGSGVRLLLVRPGFVIGAMTANSGLSPAPFSSTAEQVAEATVRALRRRTEVVWVPAVLGPIFGVLRLLPRALWRRMPR